MDSLTFPVKKKKEINKALLLTVAPKGFFVIFLANMTPTVTAKCTWTQMAGKDLSQLVPTRQSDEDVFEKPDLDDVISEDRAVLFANNDNSTTPCELQFRISQNFKIAAITIVCSAPKVELFVGATQEYLETIYGCAIEEDEGDISIRPYRYDVEIDRSGIADINLKLLTSAKEICVYGVMLHIAPNPNGITTQLQKSFDIQKIQELLQKGGSSSCAGNRTEENDEKLQKFMSMMKDIACHAQTTESADGTDTYLSLRQNIDAKFEQLELKICKRLDEIESQQSARLDKIIAILQKN